MAGSVAGLVVATGTGSNTLQALEDQRNALKNRVGEIDSATMALSAEERAQKKLNVEAREALRLAEETATTKKQQSIDAFGNSLEQSLGKALTSPQIKFDMDRIFKLPNPGIRAEEVSRGRTVTAADIPPGYYQATAGTPQREQTDLLKQILQELKRDKKSSIGVPDFNIVTMN